MSSSVDQLPEQLARQKIDAMLKASGWAVQSKNEINLSAALGVAICELSFKTGEPDYTLFVEGKAIGTVEAKPVGTTLTSVEEQSAKYVHGVPFGLPAWHSPLPFCYESTGEETYFTNRLELEPCARRVFSFHRPETLLAWAQEETQLAERLRKFPPLAAGTLWPAQIDAVTNLEKSFASGKPRALIQMATGSGKTYTAVNFIYRLVKYGGAKRILFLVDRGNLGKQTLKGVPAIRFAGEQLQVHRGIHCPAPHQQRARHLRPCCHRHDPARLFDAQRREGDRPRPRRPVD